MVITEAVRGNSNVKVAADERGVDLVP